MISNIISVSTDLDINKTFSQLKSKIEKCSFGLGNFNIFFLPGGKWNEEEVNNMCFEILKIPATKIDLSATPSELASRIRDNVIKLKSGYENTYMLTQPIKKGAINNIEGRIKAIKHNAQLLSKILASVEWFIGEAAQECLEHFSHHGISEHTLNALKPIAPHQGSQHVEVKDDSLSDEIVNAAQLSFASQERLPIGGGFFEYNETEESAEAQAVDGLVSPWDLVL